MPKGVSRNHAGEVTVDYEPMLITLSEELYKERGYQPWFDDLPIIEQEEPRL